MVSRLARWGVGGVAALFLAQATVSAAILYVDGGATGTNDGSSWANAFTDLQDAMAVVVQGQEIRVAQGLYLPDDPNGSRDASFVLRDSMILRGGFAGYGKTNPDDRDVERYETILSGDLMGNDEPLAGPWQSIHVPSRQDNSHHVVRCMAVSSDSPVLDGFIITGGQADISDTGVNRSSGAGILIQSGSPVIRNCTVRENVAESGAGVMLYACEMGYTGDLTQIIGCQIVNNSANGQAGIECCWGNIRITDCLIAGNTAVLWGGGGIHNNAAKLFLSNCRIIANTASGGGGLYNVDSEDTVIDRCVFHRNQAKEGSAIYGNVENDRFVLSNSIVWDNPCSETAAVYLSDDHESSHAWISYCDIEGGTSGVSSPHGYELEIGPGILNVDPLFADAGGGDCHLKSQAGRWDPAAKTWVLDSVTSSCIDAGDPASPIMFEPFPNGAVINIGAYGGTAEASKSWFGGPVCEVIVAGDINGDCKVDLGDFAILAGHWLENY